MNYIQEFWASASNRLYMKYQLDGQQRRIWQIKEYESKMLGYTLQLIVFVALIFLCLTKEKLIPIIWFLAKEDSAASRFTIFLVFLRIFILLNVIKRMLCCEKVFLAQDLCSLGLPKMRRNKPSKNWYWGVKLVMHFAEVVVRSTAIF